MGSPNTPTRNLLSLFNIAQLPRLWNAYRRRYCNIHLNEEVAMVSIPKVVGVLSCSFLLCLSLSTVASSADKLNIGESEGKLLTVDDKDRFVPGKEVKGEIVKIDGENYVVREASGAEVRMHVNSSTEKRSSIIPKVGEHVLAKVDAKGHAVSFLTDAPISR
ncbi:MAG: hypothetical protein NDI90_07155 [Nitrospira sp. BO4]|jgi:hypothetical protein|nr:hypothetical protein [Nitrospira sp. BO4]